MCRAVRAIVERSFSQPTRAPALKPQIMPRSQSQFAAMREESRENILRAGLVSFARRGFAATSIRMIAVEAGVSQGLLYNYFDGKGALLRAIFERSMDDVQATFASAEVAATPVDALASLVRAAFDTVRAHEDFWTLSYQVRMQAEVVADLGAELTGWTAQIVDRIEALYEAAGASDAAARARLLFAAIDGAAQHWVLDRDGYPLDEVGDEIVRLLVPRPPTVRRTEQGTRRRR